MNTIPNRQAMCEVLIEEGKKNKDLLVLTSDSRGSASMTDFAKQLPNQLVEVGIAEQNIVGISAGLAHSGKLPFVTSPAAFLSMRSIEQIKVDVAYSNTNVKLVGISGGVSYGALGMSHHSLQDFAVTRAIPNLHVLSPADRFETAAMIRALVNTEIPAYIRIGRNPVEDCYTSEHYDFEIGKAVVMREGLDVTLVGIGETVRQVLDSADILEKAGVSVEVINVHSLKPFDKKTIIQSASKTKKIITVEEHSIYGGLGSAVAECLCELTDIKQKIIALPDEELVSGDSKEVFDYYGLTGEKVAQVAKTF